MFDIGVTKLAIIGGIALIVIGPERLLGLARKVGTLLGRARRYVADVKEEVNRSMELDAIRKMRDTVEEAARDVETAVQTHASAFSDGVNSIGDSYTAGTGFPVYRHPKKKWRLKQGAIPHWYKARQGVRTRALSGAARVARHRPASH